jgi:enoyl-CoA hydratase/carnithine racemase
LLWPVISVADDVVFAGFSQAGVYPDGRQIELLQATDQQLAAWMMVFNQPVNAEDAVRTGLAWMSTPPDRLIATALDILRGRLASSD